jgi:hypothetical protein
MIPPGHAYAKQRRHSEFAMHLKFLDWRTGRRGACWRAFNGLKQCHGLTLRRDNLDAMRPAVVAVLEDDAEVAARNRVFSWMRHKRSLAGAIRARENS